MVSDIYSLDFNPNELSTTQEEVGLKYADEDTAVELMKKEEKMIIAELTLEHSKNSSYKNTTELNGLIYSDKSISSGLIDIKLLLKQGIVLKLDTRPLRLFVMTSELRS